MCWWQHDDIPGCLEELHRKCENTLEVRKSLAYVDAIPENLHLQSLVTKVSGVSPAAHLSSNRMDIRMRLRERSLTNVWHVIHLSEKCEQAFDMMLKSGRSCCRRTL